MKFYDATYEEEEPEVGQVEDDPQKKGIKIYTRVYSVCVVGEDGFLNEVARGPLPLRFDYDDQPHRVTKKDDDTILVESHNRTLYAGRRGQSSKVYHADNFRVIYEGKDFIVA